MVFLWVPDTDFYNWTSCPLYWAFREAQRHQVSFQETPPTKWEASAILYIFSLGKIYSIPCAFQAMDLVGREPFTAYPLGPISSSLPLQIPALIRHQESFSADLLHPPSGAQRLKHWLVRSRDTHTGSQEGWSGGDWQGRAAGTEQESGQADVC